MSTKYLCFHYHTNQGQYELDLNSRLLHPEKTKTKIEWLNNHVHSEQFALLFCKENRDTTLIIIFLYY